MVKKFFGVVSALALGVFVSAQAFAAEISSSTVGTDVQAWKASIAEIVGDNIGAILLVAGAIFGLLLLVRLAKRLIAGR